MNKYLAELSNYGFALCKLQRATAYFLRLLVFSVIVPLRLFASDSALLQTPDEEVGIAIKSVAFAIDTCDDPASMNTIVRYGTDTRYYRIIRGWLVQRLQGVESRVPVASAGGSQNTDVQQANCLRNAIRRIDLE